MKKRKELDALVSNGKIGSSKRINCSKKASGSCSAHELLRHDTDSSDMEDFSILQPRRKSRKKHGSRLCITSVCLSLCQFILVTTSCLVSGALIWLHIGLREDIDLLRTHLQKVEAGNRNTPEALHVIHSSLKQLDSNVSMLYQDVRKNIADIENITGQVNQLKGIAANLRESIAAAPAIQQLPKDMHSLSESVANFGSKMTALESNIKELKDQQSNLQNTATNLSGELETVKGAIQDLSNSTEMQTKSSGNAPAKDLKLENTLQETNQHVNYLQGQLNDVVSSIGKINATCNLYHELPAKVNTINDAIVWINNATLSQNSRLSSLETFVLSNITLRLEQSEPEKALSFQNPGRTDIKEYINRTVSDVVLRLINQDIFHKDVLIENSSLQPIEQTHDVLMLLAAFLRKFDQIPKAYILNQKNATELIDRMLNESFEKMVVSRDLKIEAMEQEIRNLSLCIPTSHSHDSGDADHLGDLTTPVLVQSTLKTEKLTNDEDLQLKNVLA